MNRQPKNEDLSATNSLFLNEDAFSFFFNNSPIAHVISRIDNFQIVEVNRAWESFSGHTREEAVGLSLKHFLDPLKLLGEQSHHSLLNFDEDNWNAINFRKKDGTQLSCLGVSKKFCLKNDTYLLTLIIPQNKLGHVLNAGIDHSYFIEDILLQLVNGNKLLKSEREQGVSEENILKLMAILGQDFEITLRRLLKLSCKSLNADTATLFKALDDRDTLVVIGQWSINENINDITSQDVKRSDFPKYFELIDEIKSPKKCGSGFILNSKSYSDVLNFRQEKTTRLDILSHIKNDGYYLLSLENYSSENAVDKNHAFIAPLVNLIGLLIQSKERMTLESQLFEANDELIKLNLELNVLKKKLEQENSYLREEIELAFNYEEMVYSSRAFSQVLTDVERVAATNATVLLLGESGTGKELLARAIHNISERKNKPLIKVNCAAIPRELIESEFFGHKKGSFTGAINDKLGKFQLADGGTLFLDEIGELPIEMQPKLLRAIQESEIEQVGGTKTQKVDIRIIVATNRDLQQEVKIKNFREDLYFRINVFPINIPPLRDRVEDIPILLEHFVNKYAKLYNKSVKFISEETKRNLQNYSWPGNVRELENMIERAVILSEEEKLIISNFQNSEKEILISSTVPSLDDIQRNYIQKILKQCHWKIDGPDGAAGLLQMKPSTLRDRIKKLGIKK